MSKSTAGRTRVNWLAVRTWYLDGHSAEECADRFGVSTRQIERRRSKEGWVQERRANVGRAAHNVSAAVAAELTEITLDHIAYADKLMALVLDGEADLAAMQPGRSRVEARRALIESGERAVRVARVVRGLSDGDVSTDDADLNVPIAIAQRRLDPKLVPVDERGRALPGRAGEAS